MKKMILFFTVALFGMASFAQNSAPVAKVELVKFKETTYNFGKIKQGVPVTHDFAFSNVSEKAVVVETAGVADSAVPGVTARYVGCALRIVGII